MFAAHGLDGDRLQALAWSCLQHVLRKTGAYLRAELREDLHDYFVLVAVQTAARYDPARSRPGYKFESYLWDVMQLRATDWFRSRLGDSRWRPEAVEARRRFMLALSLDNLPEHDVPAVEDDPHADDMNTAAATLAGNLSPESAWALEHLARPLAEGGRPVEAAREAGVSVQLARKLLKELREELEHVGGVQSRPMPQGTIESQRID